MNIAVIFAGGSGTRMKTKDKPKQFLEVFNKPIIIYTLEHFEKCDNIDAIVIACKKDWIEYLEKLILKFNIKKVKNIVPGGNTGQDSIYNGLIAAKEISKNNDDIVLIHDGVRPLINTKLLDENIKCVKEKGNSITSGIVKETIVVIDENKKINEVPDRANSRVAKAPQCFYLKDILDSHDKARKMNKHDFIDSCTMMQYFGYELYMTDGPYENIKITTPDDYYTMRAIIQSKEDAQLYGMDE